MFTFASKNTHDIVIILWMVADDRTNRVHRIKSNRNNIDIGRERQNLARQRQRTNKFIGMCLR